MAEDGKPILDDWRQGDLVLAPVELPQLDVEEGETVVSFIEAEHGVAVLTQSCDIVRSHEDRPVVQVAALTPADADELQRARSGQAVRYAYLPSLAERGLVIDLDISATVTKQLAQAWERTTGCTNDDERRSLAGAIARHRQRFAFPDAFNAVVKPIRKLVEKKRNVDSAQGRLVRALEEIRVTCDNWDAPTGLLFTFILDEAPPPADAPEWRQTLDDLENKLKHPDFPDPSCRLVTYDELSARELIDSDRLDLDGLSDA
jgi:hypothetical protein